MPQPEGAKFAAFIKSAKLPNAVVKSDEAQFLLVREGALPGTASWTHESCDAAHTYCSQDERVQAPLGILWYGDHNGFILANHAYDEIRPQVVGGRVFTFSQRSNRLRTYDAFTGHSFGKRSSIATAGIASFASLSDGIYFVVDGKCFVYSPETGKTINTFRFNTAGATTARELRVDGDIILIGCSDKQRREDFQPYGHSCFSEGGYRDSTELVCLDRKTGAVLWHRKALDRFGSQSLAIGAGIVFCVDSFVMIEINEPKRGLQIGRPGNNGRRKPKVSRRSSPRSLHSIRGRAMNCGPAKSAAPYRTKGGSTLQWDTWVAYAARTGLVLTGRCEAVSAFAAKTGAPAWENPAVGDAPMFVNGQRLITQNYKECSAPKGEDAFDLLTGKLLKKRIIDRSGFGGGCNYAISSKHLILKLYDTVTYADVDTGKAYYLRNLKSGCTNSLIPADGLLNAPSFTWDCLCDYAIQTSCAMVHMPEVAEWSGTRPLPLSAPPRSPRKFPSRPRRRNCSPNGRNRRRPTIFPPP